MRTYEEQFSVKILHDKRINNDFSRLEDGEEELRCYDFQLLIDVTMTCDYI